jgi:hypothetical protein
MFCLSDSKLATRTVLIVSKPSSTGTTVWSALRRVGQKLYLRCWYGKEVEVVVKWDLVVKVQLMW